MDLAFRGRISLTKFVHQAAEQGFIPTQKELTFLVTMRSLRGEAGHPLPPYNSLKYEDSGLSGYVPGKVKIDEDSEDEINSLSFECAFPTHDEQIKTANR